MSIPKRIYGTGSIELSIIGFGAIIIKDLEQDKANRIVAAAYERGINYFDVAPSYGDPEEKLGPALEPYRKECFLACKTGEREKGPAEEELTRSLKRLKTDYLDLYQLHAIHDVEKDVDVAFASNGVMELMLEAKKDGRIRHIGFSAHSPEAALAAMDRYDFDSVLFPLNFAAYTKGNFGPSIYETAKSKGISRLALKSLAKGKWKEGDPLREDYPNCWYEPVLDKQLAHQALRFTLSHDITAAIPPGDERIFNMALDIAENYSEIADEERNNLKKVAKNLEPVFTHSA
ncbi:MAG: aldo/keto reductase [Lentisphaeria bacterium]|nr:aldo/keto reductase [Lentisphaeria bacterium]NQZ69517.1 aldo/keto reductase [Lentisphaeria bacterium]